MKKLACGFLALICLGPMGCGKIGRTGGSAKNPRVLLIGIDGADLRIIDRLVRSGKLPTFARLEREGVFGALRSQEPLLSPIVWTTIATGRRPQDHGVLDFIEVGPDGQPTPITSARRRVPALWNIAGEFGKRSGFVGWYASYPAERVSGFEVSDRLGFHQVASARAVAGATFPESLASELRGRFGEPTSDLARTTRRFLGEAGSAVSADGEKRLAQLARIYETSEFYRKIVPYLQSRYPVDLLAVYFEGIDACGHLFMENAPPRRPEVSESDFRAFSATVDRYYEYQDSILADLLRLEGPETVSIIVSDHGFTVGDERPKVSGRADTGQAALWHRLDGVLFVHGKRVRPQKLSSPASIYDVAPTVLEVLDIPLSRELPGAPWTALFDPRAFAPVRRIDRYSPRPKLDARAVAASDPEAVRKLMALGYLSGVPGTIPHDPDGRTAASYFNEGLTRSEAGDASGALRSYGKAVELDPRNSKALLAAAALEIQSRRLDHAAALLDRARRIEPESFWLHLETASLDLQSGRMGDAEAELAAAERIENRLPSLFLLKARFYKASGQADRALSLLEEAERLSDRDRTLGEILILRAQIQTDRNHFDAAAEALNAAESLAPSGPLEAARGELAFVRHDGSAAERFFLRALQASPDSSVLERKLGETLGAMSRNEEARAAFERAIAKARTPEEKEGAFGDLSLLHQRQGKSRQNLETLIRATGELPQSSALWAMLGAAYGRAQDYEHAISAYERSIAARPTALACKTLAALLLEIRHDSLGATALWRRSLSLDPDQPDVRQFLRRYARAD